ncbi:MAG: ATP-dependent RecD-like DNA helicase [Thermodesulfobacteriota bacterium]
MAGEDKTPLVPLKGQIDRITYTDPESGFTVARMKAQGHRELVTVVGNFAAVSPGEVLSMKGQWDHHSKFGEQFRVSEYTTEAPATVEGIRKYLGSGLIDGIGPVMAERITDMFGPETLNIMAADITQLRRVSGIGDKRIEMIRAAWDEQKGVRDVMLFLQSNGVSTGYAIKIVRAYGGDAIKVVTSDPYRLASDISGIGFTIADRIARKLGFAKDCGPRIRAGVLYVLNHLADEGHVYFPYRRLVEKSMEMLEVDHPAVAAALEELKESRDIIMDTLDPPDEEAGEKDRAVYLSIYYRCETGIAAFLTNLMKGRKIVREIDADKALTWVQRELAMEFAEKQIEAVKTACREKIMIITGGPGTGKTTIIRAIVKIFLALKARPLLAAPTGRAAKKMKEATDHEARTIHRLLEYSLAKGGFQRNTDRPLDCDLLIIDESSMVDTVLMYHLLKAVPPSAVLILVGDVNQLPSVGAGNVLRDVIGSGAVPVVALNEIFRQARQSRIIVNAHKIINGIIPETRRDSDDSDFFFIEEPDPEKVLEIITALVKERIPRRFNLDPVDDIQVLSPMHKGVIGTASLNQRLQAALNPPEGNAVRGGEGFALHDKVMQIRNNYDKEVFNGDIGRIVHIDHDARQVTVDFDERKVAYGFSELDELVLAYAISVHKSQGSEYPAVVIPLLTQHYLLLARNLVYTAVTRGRSLVVIVGTVKALAIGVNNNKTSLRYTGLRRRLEDSRAV